MANLLNALLGLGSTEMGAAYEPQTQSPVGMALANKKLSPTVMDIMTAAIDNASAIGMGSDKRATPEQYTLNRYQLQAANAPDYKGMTEALKLVGGDDALYTSEIANRAMQRIKDGLSPQAAVFAAANDAAASGLRPSGKPMSEIGRIMADVNSGRLGNLSPQQAVTQGAQAAAGAGIPTGGITPQLLMQGAFSKALNLPAGTTIDQKTGQVVPQSGYAETQSELERAKLAGKNKAELDAAKTKREASAKAQFQTSRIVTDAIKKAKTQANWATTGGIGQITMNNAFFPAHDLQQTLQTIKGNIGFDRLQQMRDNSPTGGALGNTSEQELKTLQSVIASLEQSQSTEQFKANLDIVDSAYQNAMKNIAEAYLSDYGTYPPGFEQFTNQYMQNNIAPNDISVGGDAEASEKFSLSPIDLELMRRGIQ